MDARTKIVPGHGPITTKDDVKAFGDMLADTNDQISKLMREGKAVDQIVAAEPLKKHDASWGQGFMKSADWIKLIHHGKSLSRG